MSSDAEAPVQEASVQEAASPLSDSQVARIERNRQKALLLRQARLASRPYALDKQSREGKKAVTKVTDTGAGFFIEEEEKTESEKKTTVSHPLGAILDGDLSVCEECGKPFSDSYLLSTFDLSVCDRCRDNDEKHKLITRTEAKNVFLLKDADFDRREPPLKFIVKKNPHNPRWGDMKLYLLPQVRDRCLEVWGDEEKLEEARQARQDNAEKSKNKKYEKKMKELRRAVRSSLYKKDLSGHTHEYGEESYDDDEDMFSKTCTSCGHVLTYEKM
ncbi:hypothetical protein CAPTEDRAFT_219337 [Capitella teleta]|uniref:XPA C-terminal domain-containing protein n=1 Tax=Capitella teleta TaxID=283909 RepID=R7UL61_CAPTE|nr:hypothetical protein CAPTEDRAFT_219337 [Capitella teleta]|eukprot:ELU03972.1 hypothetical protein CAPTEDRAFT_219337 [Capitella teleta]